MAHTAPLPTPRQFLTSLLDSFPESIPGASTSNPLKALKPKDRSLLTTLHVLFPTPILLPALDLLDRQLVTRIVQAVPHPEPEPNAAAIHPPQAHIHLQSASDSSAQNKSTNANYFFEVTSASDVRGRGGGSAGGGRQSYGTTAQSQGQTYIVRTGAWNCTCAAFTFSAFPANMSAFIMRSDMENSDTEEGGMMEDGRREKIEEGGDEWEFGGASRDGKYGGQVPCCKHLLACVLVERWKGVLGRYVVERRVGRDEMAGIGAGIG